MTKPGSLSFEQLATLLQAQKDVVVSRWQEAVIQDPAVPTADNLPPRRLIDHVPHLLDQLILQLHVQAAAGGEAGPREARVGQSEASQAHAQLRFDQGYSIPEASRELLHLRRIINDVCNEAGSRVSGEAATFLHAALDEAMITLCGTMVTMAHTQQAQAESALRQTATTLRTVLDALPVGVFIMDRTGQITAANDAGIEVWGGVKWVGLDRYHEYRGWWPDTGKPVTADEWSSARAISRGETTIADMVDIEAFDGTRKTILNSSRPLKDDSGTTIGVVSVVQDITALKEAQDEAQQAARDREELVSIVSHDLKSPLSAIILNMELLLRILPEDGGKAHKRAQAIMQAAQRMNHLIHDLLDISRIRAGRFTIEPVTVKVRPLIHEAIEMLAPQADAKDLHVSSYVQPKVHDVFAERSRVLQVLANLIGNAIKFTPVGGRITISAERGEGQVVFTVRDTGPGIPADQLPQLFQRFWQAKESAGQGSGLGLAIARGIIEAHGGTIWAESTFGAGSAFSFTLPNAPTRDDERTDLSAEAA